MLDALTERSSPGPDDAPAPLLSARGVNLWYGDTQALCDVDIDIYRREIVAFIGPSGCGKTTLLKCFNRMHDFTRGVHQTGRIEMDGEDIRGRNVDPPIHRRRFGWVAQKPDPFASTIFDNVAYGPRLHGLCRTDADLEAHVEGCLTRADLWDEVRDDLHAKRGTDLSGGQQQRLCLARALALRPDVFLMDEPTGSIDPIATDHVERLIVGLRADYSVVIVTHSMMQARRISDRVAFFHSGRLLECRPTRDFFSAPEHPQARAFVAGRTG